MRKALVTMVFVMLISTLLYLRDYYDFRWLVSHATPMTREAINRAHQQRDVFTLRAWEVIGTDLGVSDPLIRVVFEDERGQLFQTFGETFMIIPKGSINPASYDMPDYWSKYTSGRGWGLFHNQRVQIYVFQSGAINAYENILK